MSTATLEKTTSRQEYIFGRGWITEERLCAAVGTSNYLNFTVGHGIDKMGLKLTSVEHVTDKILYIQGVTSNNEAFWGSYNPQTSVGTIYISVTR